MNAAFERYFHGEYAAARPYLLLRVLLGMLALDTWMLMIGHAGRYGAGGFNVAHFGFVDALAPMPSPALYIGVLLLAGLLALVVAMSGPSRPIGALLFGLYTYSWSMSMLDSFQHHYFVSLVLFCTMFFPQTAAGAIHPPDDDASDRAPTPAEAFGYPLLCATIAILYVYTTLAKCDANWVAGDTLQQISKAGEAFAPLRAMAAGLGIDGPQFWSLVSTAVIPHELFIAVGYALAPLRDRPDAPRWLRLTCTLAGAGALALHVGAEHLGLEIGWFSYYMLVLAVGVLMPTRLVDSLCRSLTTPARWLADATTEGDTEGGTPALQTVMLGMGVAAVLYYTATMIDLPGAEGAAWVAVALLLAFVLLEVAAERPPSPRPRVLATGVGAAVMWLSISYSDVRWDYYRFRGGDLMRRGQLQEALSTYERGERYAVDRACESDRACARYPGASCTAGYCVDAGGDRLRDTRMHKIEQLRRMLGK